MGFLNRALKNDPDANLQAWLMADGSWEPAYAGVSVTRESAMRVSTVYACYRIISNTFITLPADTYTMQGDDRVVSRPQPPWLTRPNAEQLWCEFAPQLAGSLVSAGNYFVDVRNAPNLFILDPQKVMVGRVQSADSRSGLRSNELIYTVDGNVFTRREILHVRSGVTLPGSDRGLSPLDVARQEAGISLAAQRFQASFFRNGATVSAALEMPLGTTEAQARLQETLWNETHQGPDSQNKTAILAGASYKPMAIPQAQMQFLESRDFSVIDIGTRIFGVPAHRLGVITKQTSFGVGMESQNNAFVMDAILPNGGLIEAGLSSLLPGDVHLLFDLNGLMRGDSRARSAYYNAGITGGWLCQDNVRKAEGFNPIPGGLGKVFRTQQTLVPLGSTPPAPQDGAQ